MATRPTKTKATAEFTKPEPLQQKESAEPVVIEITSELYRELRAIDFPNLTTREDQYFIFYWSKE
jgi:hypothetical protein